MNSQEQESKKKNTSPFIRFSTLGIQMGVIIAFFTWFGIFLDERFKTITPWWTISLSIFGVCASLYLVIKEVIKMGQNEK